ncbi:MazG nucleotide pyrophosphohydrolase domain-containing protein [Turicibacter sanguinis]|uniref:MazG nucleotide pyrophosphohydrolase domain-containing protein n=1 Tax=Turicibacter sanguinis TaxID=154288 RepID=UPI001E28F510|nr:MazG nucleotide pyrophosphohydrolase domain-containing protein [Turicibacter sanguinis]
MNQYDSMICRKAVETFGAELQQMVAIEEMGELLQAISKRARGKDNRDNLAEEIADVEIMLEQLKHCYGCHIQADDYKRRKIDKLKSMVEGVRV